jgi:hypothetical protein
VDLKLPIAISDELSETIIHSKAILDLASGEIHGVHYQDYNRQIQGLPAEHADYEFTCGLLRSGERELEFRVEVDILTGKYSITPSELLELKGRAAKLFSGK